MMFQGCSSEKLECLYLLPNLPSPRSLHTQGGCMDLLSTSKIAASSHTGNFEKSRINFGPLSTFPPIIRIDIYICTYIVEYHTLQ